MWRALAGMLIVGLLGIPAVASAQAPGGLPWDVPQRGGLQSGGTSGTGRTPAQAKQPDPVLLAYSAEIVSDYVFRGDDMYVRQFTKYGKEHTPFDVSPAFRPSVTFLSPTITLNILGTFAMTNRQDKPDNNKGAFFGLEREDEVDYTLAYHWRNDLGHFTGGLVHYSFLDQGRVGPTRSTPPAEPAANPTEFMVGWDFPFWAKLNPSFWHYSGQNYGDWYSAFDFDGHLSRRWGWYMNFGFVRTGPKDITGQLRWDLSHINLTFNGAYRPIPKTVSYQGFSGYDTHGTYLIDATESPKRGNYPPAIFWLGISWNGTVRGKG